MDEKSMIIEQERQAKAKKRKKYRKLKWVAGISAVLLIGSSTWYMVQGRYLLAASQSNTVEIVAGTNQEIVYAYIERINGNEITYRITEEPVTVMTGTESAESSRDAGQMPEGMDFGNGKMPDFGSGEMPDFGSGEMPDFDNGEMPDFGSGEIPDFGNGETPGNGENSDLSSEGQGGARQNSDGEMPSFGGNQNGGRGFGGNNSGNISSGETFEVPEIPDLSALSGNTEAAGGNGQTEGNKEAANTGETQNGGENAPGRGQMQGNGGRPDMSSNEGQDGEGQSSENGEMPSIGGLGQRGEVFAEQSGVAAESTTMSEETYTKYIPVGTDVTTKLGTVTTFSRLAAGDTVALIMEKDGDEQVIVAVYIVG